MRGLSVAVALLALTGCAQMSQPKVDLVEPTSARPLPTHPVAAAAASPAHPAAGSIFQAASYRPLFEDYRARLVGDTITISIEEKISATAESTSSIDKNATLDAGVTALPGFSSNSFNRATAEATTKNNFSGKGSTENTNEFSGTVTATVIEVLPNGHLVVSGEKQIGINHNVDVLRFSGQVDPRSIRPGNTVPSTAMANVRIEQRGRGAQADAQGIGWIGRFFLSVLPL